MAFGLLSQDPLSMLFYASTRHFFTGKPQMCCLCFLSFITLRLVMREEILESRLVVHQGPSV